MAHARRHTKDYLIHLRTKIAEVIANGVGQEKAYLVDQTEFSDLEAFELISRLKAGMLFELMEFEE
ncbi:MAG: hypothetical protein RBT59_10800, partial [Arcobacteraceae bacterium]|jgi:hypothetical protein|nr:hypothetical protein [Arcobacteraceae bacterium]